MPTRIAPKQKQTRVETVGAPTSTAAVMPPVPPLPEVSPLIDDTRTSAHRVWSSERTVAEFAAVQQGQTSADADNALTIGSDGKLFVAGLTLISNHW